MGNNEMIWPEHTRILREHINALEEHGHLDGSAPAFLANVKMIEYLDETERALRERDSMKKGDSK